MERRPDFFLHLARQRLNRPRTAGGVDRLQETEFLLEHDLDVARNAARKLIALADGFIKRRTLKGVDAADNAREDLRRVAEHVDIRIVNGLEEECGARMDTHLLRLGIPAKGLHDLCPERAHSAQLSDLQEEVCPH